MLFKQISPLTRSAYNYNLMPYISDARGWAKVGEINEDRLLMLFRNEWGIWKGGFLSGFFSYLYSSVQFGVWIDAWVGFHDQSVSRCSVSPHMRLPSCTQESNWVKCQNVKFYYPCVKHTSLNPLWNAAGSEEWFVLVSLADCWIWNTKKDRL